MTDRPPFLEVTVAASADEVWGALRDPEQIRRWFGWEYEGIEGEIALIFQGAAPEGVELPEGVDTSIDVDDAARALRTGPHRIEVADEAGRTVVRVTRVHDVDEPGWEMFATDIDAIEEGWLTFFQTLAFAVARHPGAPRRTAFGMGVVGDGDPGGLTGLDVGALTPGDRYAATTAMGDEIAGEVWFTSPAQVGLTVDAWGDGLLVAALVPGGEPGARPAMAIASTYGIADQAHADLEARWATWWAAHAPPA